MLFTAALLTSFSLTASEPFYNSLAQTSFARAAVTDSASAMLKLWLQKTADRLHAEIGVAFRDLHTGREFFFNERTMMHAASTMKVPVMIEVFRQAESGRLRLADSLLIKNEFASIVDGSRYALDLADDSDESLYKTLGQAATIRSLVEAMITVSSNLATNLLIDTVNAQNVMNTLATLGAYHMKVLRGVEDAKAYAAGLNNRTDAYDLMLTLEAIVQNRAASVASCSEMIEILKRQKFRENIPAGLPPEVVVANKTGSITALDHDAAIIFPPDRQPCLMVVLTRGIENHEQAHAAIAAIAQQLYQAFVAKS